MATGEGKQHFPSFQRSKKMMDVIGLAIEGSSIYIPKNVLSVLTHTAITVACKKYLSGRSTAKFDTVF